MYAVDSVLVNAGMLRNSVTVTGPPAPSAEGAAASVSVELGEGVGECEVAAAVAAFEAGEVEEEDAEDVAAISQR